MTTLKSQNINQLKYSAQLNDVMSLNLTRKKGRFGPPQSYQDSINTLYPLSLFESIKLIDFVLT